MKKILVTVDFSDVTGKVVEEGVKLAKAFGAEIVLMHTEPPDEGYVFYDAGYSVEGTVGFMNEYNPELEKSQQEKVENDEHALNALKEHVVSCGVKAETYLLEGDVSGEIVKKSVEINADMIVLGNHRHGKLYKFLFNDVGTHIMSHAPCPVLVVPTS